MGALAVIGAALAVPSSRARLLGAAASLIATDDPLSPAAVIVIAPDADGAGILEAADLFHRGIAARVALFADPPDSIDREFLRRGVPYENASARAARQLRALGVDHVETIPMAVTGTEDEGRVLPQWCAAGHVDSVVFVSQSDHASRTRRILRRTMKGLPTRVIVRSSAFSPFEADRWWQSRSGVRTFMIELQKLVLDVISHPLS